MLRFISITANLVQCTESHDLKMDNKWNDAVILNMVKFVKMTESSIWHNKTFRWSSIWFTAHTNNNSVLVATWFRICHHLSNKARVSRILACEVNNWQLDRSLFHLKPMVFFSFPFSFYARPIFWKMNTYLWFSVSHKAKVNAIKEIYQPSSYYNQIS